MIFVCIVSKGNKKIYNFQGNMPSACDQFPQMVEGKYIDT